MIFFFFFFQAEDGIRDSSVTGVQTCALPIFCARDWAKHTWLGRSVLALTEQIVWPAAAQGQPPVPPLSTAPGPPLGYGPTGLPPLNPGASNWPMKEKLFGLPSHPFGSRSTF